MCMALGVICYMYHMTYQPKKTFFSKGALRGARSSGLVRTWGDFPRHPGYRCASRSQQGSLADPIEGLVPFPCAGLRQRLIHTVAT